jgi:hypothetical protein
MTLYGPDRFERQVYYIEAIDLFLVINYHATPTGKSWVAVERLNAMEITVEPFRGQPFIGVVRILKPYQLKLSEHWNSRPLKICPD